MSDDIRAVLRHIEAKQSVDYAWEELGDLAQELESRLDPKTMERLQSILKHIYAAKIDLGVIGVRSGIVPPALSDLGEFL